MEFLVGGRVPASSLNPKLFASFIFRGTALLPRTKSGTPLSLLTSITDEPFCYPLEFTCFLFVLPRFSEPRSRLLALLSCRSAGCLFEYDLWVVVFPPLLGPENESRFLFIVKPILNQISYVIQII